MKDEGMQGWRPIETAPKDETDVLLLCEGAAVEGFYRTDAAAWDSTVFGWLTEWEITHWRPLPPPPGVEEPDPSEALRLLKEERDRLNVQVEDLTETMADMRRALLSIVDYPPEGHPRRTDDGYPVEVIYDGFAYKRIVNSFRSGISAIIKDFTDKALSPSSTADPKEPSQ